MPEMPPSDTFFVMPALTHPLPRITASQAQEILAAHWDIRGVLRPLPGERERNFHVYPEEGREFVLKIASPLEATATIELQVAALEFLAEQLPSAPVPRMVPASDGRRIVAHDIAGEGHTARLLTWLPGRPLAVVSPHAGGLLQDIGESLGSVAQALSPGKVSPHRIPTQQSVRL